MSVSITEITTRMNKRTQSTASSKIRSFLNNEVRQDIEWKVQKTWPDYFNQEPIVLEIDPETATEYTVTDLEQFVSAATPTGVIVKRGTNAPDGVEGEKNYIKVVGNVITVSPETTLKEIVIQHRKGIPDVPETDPIDLPDEITAELLPVWSNGADFYIFDSNGKYDRASSANQKYNVSQKSFVAPAIISLS